MVAGAATATIVGFVALDSACSFVRPKVARSLCFAAVLTVVASASARMPTNAYPESAKRPAVFDSLGMTATGQEAAAQ